MFELSLSPAIAPTVAPVLVAPATGTGDFALALAEVTAELTAANPNADAVIVPPDRQKLAAPAGAPLTTGETPILVLDPATPISLPRFQLGASPQAAPSRATEQLRDPASVTRLPTRAVSPTEPLQEGASVTLVASADRASTPRDTAPAVRDRDVPPEGATIIWAAPLIALPVVHVVPAQPSTDGRRPAIGTPALALPPIAVEPTAQALPKAEGRSNADLTAVSVGAPELALPPATAIAAPVHADSIARAADQHPLLIIRPVLTATPVPVLIQPGAVDPAPPVLPPIVASSNPAPTTPIVPPLPEVGVPVPALRAFAAAIAATAAPSVRPVRGDETLSVRTSVASPPAIPVSRTDAPITQTFVVTEPREVPSPANASSPKQGEVAVQSVRPARLSRDDDALVTPLAAFAQTDGAARPVDAIARPLPPVDMRREDWTRALIDRIDAVREVANARDTRITLVPDALGKIDVALRQEGGTLHVAFTADAPATQLLLIEAQPRLAELAEARGLKLGDTAISANPDGDRAASGFGQPADQRRPAPAPQGSASNRSTTTNPAPDRADSDNRIA